MPICPKCNREMPVVRRNSAISDLCEECYDRERYDRIKYPMPKKFLEQLIVRSSSEAQPVFEVFEELNAGWDQLHELIKKQGRDEGYSIAFVIQEISQSEALKSFVQSGMVTLRCSYFFTNSRFDCIPTFEDRDKQCAAFIL